VTLHPVHGWILLTIALWNVLSFGMFAANLYDAYAAGEERATGYWVAHSVLVVVNDAVAGVLAWLGLRLLRGTSG
jgi:hypothetical protein